MDDSIDIIVPDDMVSIPSNGSIQFLFDKLTKQLARRSRWSQSPLTGQFNFYRIVRGCAKANSGKSQSPLTGQFNFYDELRNDERIIALASQSPLTGQFNFYIIASARCVDRMRYMSQSPLTGQFNFYKPVARTAEIHRTPNVSIPSNGSIQFLSFLGRYILIDVSLRSQSPLTGQFNFYIKQRFPIWIFLQVSIPSNGSIQFLSILRC